MGNPRQTAYEALVKLAKDNSYSNITLDHILSKSTLDTRDKSFVSALFYGVIERMITLDYNLGLYLSKPIKKLKPEVLVAMRLGAYQILYMDKIPHSAAVNESIKIAKKNGLNFASGLINAVLRKVSLNGECLPDENDYENYISVRYSCPKWLVKKWIAEYGLSDTEHILKHSLGTPSVYIRVNTLRTDADSLIDLLFNEGVIAEKTYLENALKIILNGKDIENLDSFKKGFFHVQDLACQICLKALDISHEDTVFDICAAPGGKTFTAAQYAEKGKIKSFDLYDKRVELIKKGSERLNLTNVEAATHDATDFCESFGKADRVLCDVPCSGLGIIGKKPEIKYKSENEIEEITKVQYPILDTAAKYVKNGGKLLYSTCTLSKTENEDVCEKFLQKHTDFKKIKPVPVISDDYFVTLMPHKNETDGFFIALFEKDE